MKKLEKRRFKFSEAVFDPRDERWKMPEDVKFSVAERAQIALPGLADKAIKIAFWSLAVPLLYAFFVFVFMALRQSAGI